VPTPEIRRSSPLAEEILESHRHRVHGDDAGYDAYKAHVYRVMNFARAFAPDEPDRDDKRAIAAAFHDLAAFDTLDYLVPSIAAQDAWLQQTDRESWSDELALIVAEHHRLSAYDPNRPHAPLVEAVRRADLIDVSQGLTRFGLPSSYVKGSSRVVRRRRLLQAGDSFGGHCGQSASFSSPASCVPATRWPVQGTKGSIASFAPRHCRYWLVGQDLSS
jgi:hypothetical protein